MINVGAAELFIWSVCLKMQGVKGEGWGWGLFLCNSRCCVKNKDVLIVTYSAPLPLIYRNLYQVIAGSFSPPFPPPLAEL